MQRKSKTSISKALQTQQSQFIPIFRNKKQQAGESFVSCKSSGRQSPTRNVGVQEKMSEFNPELWDLQFDRWWGWNFTRKQEEENLKKSSVFNKRNNANLQRHSDYALTAQTKAEPYKEISKFQQFIKFLKDTYYTIKTKFDKKPEPQRIIEPERILYTLPKIPPYKKEPAPPEHHKETFITSSQHYYMKKDADCQRSISSLVVQAEGRRKNYKRKKKSVQTWVVKSDDESSSEGEERVLKCISMEETYTTSAEGGENYLANRLQNIRFDNEEILKNKMNKLVYVRNRRVQTAEEETELCSKSVDNAINSVEEIKKETIATETREFDETPKKTNLVEKGCYASPLSGHLYNINVPQFEVTPALIYSHSSHSMFNFIEEGDVTDLQTVINGDDREHQKLLTAVFEALLSSREEQVVNYCYTDSFRVSKNENVNVSDKKSAESQLKAKDLYVAPNFVSSTSCDNRFFCTAGVQNSPTESWEDTFEDTNKRKAPFNAIADVIPTKSCKMSSQEKFLMPKKRFYKKGIRSNSSSSTTSYLDGGDLLPVILEDDVLTSDFKSFNKTNPFFQTNFSGSNSGSQTSSRDGVIQNMDAPQYGQKESCTSTFENTIDLEDSWSYNKMRMEYDKSSILACKREWNNKKLKLN